MSERTEDVVGLDDGRIFRCTLVTEPLEAWLRVEELSREGGARLAELHAFVPGAIGWERVEQEFRHLPMRTVDQLVCALRRISEA